MMDILRIPNHHVMLQTFLVMRTGTQYSAQMCIVPKQAQVSMLRRYH